MTDSESPDSPSNPEDEDTPGDFSLTNEDFDFSNVAISETSYYNRLDAILSREFVSDLSHSLALNEVAVALTPDFSGRISTADFPAEMTIRHVGEWTTEDDTDDRLCIELSTTRLFCTPEDHDEYFPGTYDPEAIAALAVELNLFSEVQTATPASGADGESVADAMLTENLRSTFLFDDVMTFLGYNIHDVWIDNGVIERLRFGVSERRVWSRDEAYVAFQSSKAQSYRGALLDASDPERLPCEHEAAPTISMVSALPTSDLAAFPTVLVGDSACHEVPVVDADDAILEVADWPDGIEAEDRDDDFTTMAIERGYLCDTCDTYYPFVDAESVGRDRTPPGTEQETGAVVSVDGEQYVLAYIPIAARPVGYQDGFVEDQ